MGNQNRTRIAELERQVEQLERQAEDLQQQLDLSINQWNHAQDRERAMRLLITDLERRVAAAVLREQEIAQKWRAKNQQLAQELQLAQCGLTSGCGCPIGSCQGRGADSGSCWVQWAESHALARMANMRIAELVRHGNHPSRFAEYRNTGQTVPKLANAEPDLPPAA